MSEALVMRETEEEAMYLTAYLKSYWQQLGCRFLLGSGIAGLLFVTLSCLAGWLEGGVFGWHTVEAVAVIALVVLGANCIPLLFFICLGGEKKTRWLKWLGSAG